MRRALGEDDSKTVGVANNLPLTLSGQGEVDEAGKLYLWVLQTRQDSEGDDHPHTLGAAANLAEHYVGLGRLHEAERLHRDVLERRRRILGDDHPDTITGEGEPGSRRTASPKRLRGETKGAGGETRRDTLPVAIRLVGCCWTIPGTMRRSH